MSSFGWDIDGVLYPWHEYAYQQAEPYIDGMSFDEFWHPTTGWVVENEGTMLMKNIVGNPRNYYKQDISQYIVGILHEIQEKTGKDFCYVTGRPKIAQLETKKLLSRAKVPNWDKLYFTGHGESKGPIVKELGCIYYVEDRPKHVPEVNPHAIVFLMDQIYNRDMEFDNTIRIEDLSEILDHV